MIDDVLRFLIYCRLQSSLGSGQFGEVYKATWSIDDQELELAVKTLKAGASGEDKVKFLQEAAIMGQFSHTNVIKMYGVVTLGEPVSRTNSNKTITWTLRLHWIHAHRPLKSH